MKFSTRLILTLFVVAGGGVDLGLSFQTRDVGLQRRGNGIRPLSVTSIKNSLKDNEFFGGGGSEFDTVGTVPSDDDLFESLRGRKEALSRGIGKRYIARTQKGFLNVHYEPSDPFDTSNVVSQLSEGQIVTSTGPSRGHWILHDAGGWSVAQHGGFTWLEPIDE